MINIKKRSDFLNKEINQVYDLVIIGGGITGAGVLLDASSRGINTLLIEKGDYASGTSSKSTKLIHGGLRYLKKLEFKIVRDVGRERKISHKNAPHLVIPEKMLIPLTKNGSFKKWQLNIALFIYDLLAGVKGSDKRKILSKEETFKKEPCLKDNKLTGAGYYAEYRTDDARLTIEIIKTATKYNGESINYLEAKSIVKNDYFLIECFDSIQQKNVTIKSKKLVNACGPWVDFTRKNENKISTSKIRLSKGVHIVLNHDKLPLKQSVYYDADKGRMCFAIPRGRVTYVGTTDDDFSGHPDSPTTTNKDVKYLLNYINKTFSKNLTENDVISSWAGLRPLIEQEGKKSTELSRKDEIFISNSGMISIAGGKLTGYRLMGKKVVDIISKDLNINLECFTEKIPISGNFNPKFNDYNDFKQTVIAELLKKNLDEDISDYLIQNYGLNCLSIISEYEPSKNSSFEEVEIIYTIENEGVCFPMDYFMRRSGKMYFDPDSISSKIFNLSKIFQDNLNLSEIDLFINKVLIKKKNLTDFSNED